MIVEDHIKILKNCIRKKTHFPTAHKFYSENERFVKISILKEH